MRPLNSVANNINQFSWNVCVSISWHTMLKILHGVTWLQADCQIGWLIGGVNSLQSTISTALLFISLEID